MPDAPILDVPKLNEYEMQQLQVLLFRYLANKPAGFANVITEKLVNKCQSTPGFAPPVAESAETQKRKATAKVPEAAGASD